MRPVTSPDVAPAYTYPECQSPENLIAGSPKSSHHTQFHPQGSGRRAGPRQVSRRPREMAPPGFGPYLVWTGAWRTAPALRRPLSAVQLILESANPMRIATHGPVLLALRDPLADGVAADVCRELELAVERLIAIPADLETLPQATALVYDAQPFCTAPAILRTLGRRRPLLPIVVFPSMSPGVADVLMEVARTRSATAIECWGHASDRIRLRNGLIRHLLPAPGAALVRALEAILPAIGPRPPLDVARSIVRLRLRGDRTTVGTVAATLGVRARTLARRWPREMGTPKQFVDTVTLLLALHAHEWSGAGWERIANDLGMAEGTLRKLRHESNAANNGALAEAFLSLAKHCGATPEQGGRGLRLLSA